MQLITGTEAANALDILRHPFVIGVGADHGSVGSVRMWRDCAACDAHRVWAWLVRVRVGLDRPGALTQCDPSALRGGVIAELHAGERDPHESRHRFSRSASTVSPCRAAPATLGNLVRGSPP